MVIGATPVSKAPGLPKYLVYKHFLDWILQLDKQVMASGSSDPYKFAESFADHAGLANSDLDVLKKEASALSFDLTALDEKASRLIAEFREQAAGASESGKPLPPIPDELHDMQHLRTAISVHHLAVIQAALRPAERASLDAYVAREFAPHLSIKQASAPISSTTAENSLNSR